MAVQDYKINYKSDFVLTINGDAGWATQFCIKFWTGMPSQAYFVGFDGVKYVNCRVGDTPTQLLVMFDDHHLPIGPMKMQIAYHTTIEEFPGSVFDEVTNARDVIVTIEGTDYQVMLDFTGEDAPELEFDLPAYANEAERIQNELQRQQNEADRIAAELQREQATAAAVQGAENVNAQLAGNILTVTNRNGVSTSVNTKGEQGEQGPVGPEGPQGEQGPKGDKGDTGATGPQGSTGPQGPKGDTGVSINDFVETGETETDTLYDIEFSDGTTKPVAIPKGEKGDQGEQGPEGPQGPMGDVAVITPEQQAAFTMYSETGQNTNGPMTQKAVTDEFLENNVFIDTKEIDISSLQHKNGLINRSVWLVPVSTLARKHISFPAYAGEVYHITANSTKATSYAFLATDEIPTTQNQPVTFASGTSAIAIPAGETAEFVIPVDCYLAIAAGNVTDGDCLPVSVIRTKESTVKEKIEDIEDYNLLQASKNINIFGYGGVNSGTGVWFSSNNYICSDIVNIDRYFKFTLAVSTTATLYAIDIIKFKGAIYVSSILSYMGDTIEVDDTFDSIRFRLYASSSWTSEHVSNTSATLTGYLYKIEDKADNNNIGISDIDGSIFGKRTVIDLSGYNAEYGYIAHAYWITRTGAADPFLRMHITLPVSEGEIYQIRGNITNGSAIFLLTNNDVVTTSNQNASLVDGTQAIIIGAGDTCTVVIPHGCNYMALSKSLSTINDTIPSSVYKIESASPTIKACDVDGFYIVDNSGNAIAQFVDGEIKTKNFDSSRAHSIEGVELDYITSIQQTTKVLTLEEQEMIPTTGVCITAHEGHLYCSIDGIKYEINLTAV